jgi:hypothetical protein
MQFDCGTRILRVSHGRVEHPSGISTPAEILGRGPAPPRRGSRTPEPLFQAVRHVRPQPTSREPPCKTPSSHPLGVSGLDPDYIFWIVIVTMITGPAVRLYDTQKPWFS